MDGRMTFRNWNFTEQSEPQHSNHHHNGNAFTSHLGLQLRSSMDEKPLFGVGGVNGVREHHHVHPLPVMSSINGGPFHHHRVGGVTDSHMPNNFWINQEREKYVNLLSGNRQHSFYQPIFGVPPEASSVHSIQMPQQMTMPKSEIVVPQMEEVVEEVENDNNVLIQKKRAGEKLKSAPKEKKPRTRVPRVPKDDPSTSANRARAPKKRAEVVINGVSMDITGIAIPVCSCTGTPQQCYRWGSGGWQSACCTTSLSTYPLPMSTKRRGARIAGRKMSIGAFTKVLEKLASEGYDFSNAIDLKSYWAKHGTNKFVTIR